MGGKSESSSSSTNTTHQEDKRVGADNGAIALGEGATLTVDMTAPEAFDLAGNVLDGARGFAEASLELVNNNTQQVLEFLRERSQDESTTLAEKALKIGVPVAFAVAAVVMVTRGK